MRNPSLIHSADGRAQARQSHYAVTGLMRQSWVRLSLSEELESRATSGGAGGRGGRAQNQEKIDQPRMLPNTAWDKRVTGA